MKGIIPPMITPLSGRDELNYKGLERLIEHLIDGDVRGIFVLGTTGEAPSLSYRLRRELIERTCQQVARRVPVLVGITDTSFIESVNLAKVAAKAGAMAVVLSTPYYFPAGQTELASYVENLVPQLPLPVVLYNIPSLTKVEFEFATLQRLSQLYSVIGIKDSSGNLEYFGRLLELRRDRPDWFFLIGPEASLVDSVRLGGDGGVSGGANIFPSLFVELYAAAAQGNQNRVSELQNIVLKLQAIYDIGKYASRFIKATKCAVALQGISDDFLAEPFHRFLPPERARVAEIVAEVEALGIAAGVIRPRV